MWDSEWGESLNDRDTCTSFVCQCLRRAFVNLSELEGRLLGGYTVIRTSVLGQGVKFQSSNSLPSSLGQGVQWSVTGRQLLSVREGT